MWAPIHFFSFLVVTGIALYLAFKAVHVRYTYIRLGKPASIPRNTKERLKAFSAEVFGQKKLLKDRKSGWMHVIVFYGFIILQFGAVDLIYKGLSGKPLPIPGYDTFSLMQEITVLLVLLAAGYAGYRRYIEKVKRLKKGWKPSIVLLFIFSLMLSILFTLALERAVLQHGFSWYAPVSSSISLLFEGGSPQTAYVLYYTFWWIHLVILLSFAIYVPQSKHFHIITAPLNIWLKKSEPAGKLKTLDLEDENAESFGVSSIEEFTQKQMLDFYACVECGRCTNVCPASNTGKSLSPMHMIVKLRDHLTEKGQLLTSKSPWVPSFVFGTEGSHSFQPPDHSESFPEHAVTDIAPTMQRQKLGWTMTDKKIEDVQLIGDVMSEEEVWECTTCRNCEDQCPVGNEHVDKIIDLRRQLVLMQGSIPSGGQRALQNIERQGNPWGFSKKDRFQWKEEAEDVHVPTVKENPGFEVLYFVGSMGSYDNRNNKVTRSLVQLLNKANVNFAVLGEEEKNSGDTARRLGNEFLFQELCKENIEIFKKYNVKKIVTACPHTYNTLKNEYPEFGLEADVYHHTELLEQLVKEEKLVPVREVQERITYHDSCYLGRYNQVYEQPRNILRAIPGVELVEMERTRENGMCCGAGGGMMWMEETAGKRVNVARVEQAMAVSPTLISSACPYCLTMMSDGAKLKNVDEQVKTKDIAEILAAAVL
ncbi:(Fe-S)-binding protein [Paenibacillus naphthalenovorans]|uniref:(Fe-S)-binding protein n=1 Tax=Paenibacillus naphthalenovorans TaxID=162209 RepID=UPI003D29400E